MGEHPVKVYIYDLSKGLARSMSQAFLGKQLDGIWHTGIVAYGQEFYYGGMGIEGCEPGGTILGRPDSVCDLGKSEVPFEIFMDYLHDLSSSTFRNERYHLLDHNCNTFSNEVAQFLTGKPIPEHITNLPQEVLNTPFGAMIKPFLDALSVNPEGGHQLFSGSTSSPSPPAVAKPKEKEQNSSGPSNSASTRNKQEQSKAKESAPAAAQSKNLSPIIHKASLDANSLRKNIKVAMLEAREKEIMEEVVEYLNLSECSWSLGKLHMDILCKCLMNETNHNLASNLLIKLIENQDFLQLLKMDTNKSLIKIGHSISSLTKSQQKGYCKLLCNLCADASGKDYLTKLEEWKISDIVVTNKNLLIKTCVHCVLSLDGEVSALGSSIAYNISLSETQADTIIEIAGAIIQQLTDKNLQSLGEEGAGWSIGALCKFTEVSREVTELASVMQLDVKKFTSENEKLQQRCAELGQKLEHIEI